MTCPSKSGYTVLVICYEPFVYNVAFNANGGTGKMDMMSGLSYTNTTTKLTANAFTRKGYTFAGWALDAAGTGTTFDDQASVGGAKFGVTADGQQVNLSAQWTANTYTVAYNENNGTAGSSRPAWATYDTAFRVSAPTRTGYTFTGWTVLGHDAETACSGSSATACNAKIGTDGMISTTGATGDIWLKNLTPTAGATVKLTAQWTPLTCRVTFSKEGGSGGTSNLDIHYGQTAEGLATIEPPTRVNYTFRGYYTTASGEDDCYFDANGRLQRTWDIAATDCTLYARWQAETYVVSFSPNGGKGTMADLSVAYEETFTLPDGKGLTAPSDERVFGGWALSADASKAAFASGGSTSISANRGYLSEKKLTFYAYWQDNSRTISVDANGGMASSNAFSVVIGKCYDARGPLPTATWENGRKLFTGWYTAATDGNLVEASETVPENPPTTLYAHWTNAAYTVTFAANGGTGTMTDQTLYFETAGTLAANVFWRTGYTFAGWATTNAPTKVAYADKATVTDLAMCGGETVTLKAVWTANTYYVTFDPNGGSGTMPPLTNRYDQAFTLPVNRFTRNGFWTFAGWATASAPTTVAYEDGAMVKNLTATAGATVTLKAVWQTSLSSLSQAMHCDNLDWKNISSSGTSATDWEAFSGAGVGYGTSSCVRQANSGTGKKSYLTASLGKSDTGVKGTLSFWWKPTGEKSVLAYAVNTSEATIGSGGTRLAFLKDQWTNVVIRVDAQGSAETYVHFINVTTDGSDGYCLIDGMKWTPDGTHPEPGAGDAVEVSAVTMANGKLSLSFTGEARFSYRLLATDSLSPAVWYDFGTTNVGTGAAQAFDIPIDATHPQRFFKIETIQTLDE